jgi:hypothetical protein
MKLPSPTPISSNDHAFIIWTRRLGEHFPDLASVHWSHSIYELIVSSVPCSGYYGLVSSILASICCHAQKLLPVGDGQAMLCA